MIPVKSGRMITSKAKILTFLFTPQAPLLHLCLKKISKESCL